MLVDQMLTEHVRNFTVPAHTSIDTWALKAAYEDVRSDFTETKWTVFKYKNKTITVASKGTEFQDFKKQFSDSERCYGYIRIQTGDEISKRTKFVLITWIGKDVGVMHRAKVINDKSLVKEIVKAFMHSVFVNAFALMLMGSAVSSIFKSEGWVHSVSGQTYAAEFQLENSSEIKESFFTEELSKIGGAKYGTGTYVN